MAALALPGLLVTAPLAAHLPGPQQGLVPRCGPSRRPRRAPGRLRRRRRPQRHRQRRGGGGDRGGRPRRARRRRPAGGRIPVVVKRAIDVIVAATLLVAASPLMLAIALVMRVVDGPPMLFRQPRSGRGGRPFELVKFRTMRPLRPGETAPQDDAQRITRVGRFLRATSLDELPTLLHVVRGEMSLVGPRPLPVEYLTRYDDTEARRLEVRPGVTGWAQVHGRNASGWDERLALDVWYVDHRSLLLDLRILARTVRMVLRGEGVDQAPGVTMTRVPRARRRDPVPVPVAALRPLRVAHLTTVDMSLALLLEAQLVAVAARGGRGHRHQRPGPLRLRHRTPGGAPRPPRRAPRAAGARGRIYGPPPRCGACSAAGAADRAPHAQPEAGRVRADRRPPRPCADRRQHGARPVRDARRPAPAPPRRLRAGGIRLTVVGPGAGAERGGRRAHAPAPPRPPGQAPPPRQRRRPPPVPARCARPLRPGRHAQDVGRR